MGDDSYKVNRNEGFGLRVRLLLEYHHLTLKDVALATGCAISTVSTWRNGRIPSSRQKMEKLAELFKVSPEFLAYGRSSRLPYSKESSIDQEIIGINRVTNVEIHDSLRSKIEGYFRAYLDQAANIPGGLEYVYFNLIRTFPYEDLEKMGKYFPQD